MALVISKKVRTILIIVLVVLLLGGGGFIVWRVTQEESVAPEDSEAAPADGVGGTLPLPCDGYTIELDDATHVAGSSHIGEEWGQWVCGEGCAKEFSGGINCPPTRTFAIQDGDLLEGIYSITAIVGRGHEGQTQSQENFVLSINNLPNDRPDESTGGSSGSYKEIVDNLGDFHILEESNTATMTSTAPSCNQIGDYPPNSVHLYKLCLTQENICEEGTWSDQPTGEYAYGTTPRSTTISTTDTDGLGEVTISINGTGISACESTGGGGLSQSTEGVTCYTKEGNSIKLSLDPGIEAVSAGSYSVSVSWEDGLGIGGSNCTLSTTFTVLDEEVDPACGTLAKTYPASTTEWPDGTFCIDGEPEPANPVFPSIGGTTSWTCGDADPVVSCTARREAETPVTPPDDPDPVVPQTGIFDTVLGRVSLGVSFIFLGGLVSQYSRLNYFFNSISEKNQFRKDINQQRRREKSSNKRRNRLEERFK